MADILSNKYFEKPSVFLPENLLREARRQKNITESNVPEICLLDPDGDLADFLVLTGKAALKKEWACYHSKMFCFLHDGFEIGIVPCIVGASYAVLVAEQLFVSGCKTLISVTSAGIIRPPLKDKKFALINEAVRDEGTSYHYIPAEKKAVLLPKLAALLKYSEDSACPYFDAKSWTTDAPYRETQPAIDIMYGMNISCVEMEAAALYAFSEAKQKDIICLAHLTNTMAQAEGDFEKGEHFGSLATLDLLSFLLKKIRAHGD